MPAKVRDKRPVAIKIAISLLALLGYGGWAVYSNQLDGNHSAMLVAWRAGAIQGGYSALLTLLSMILLESVYRRVYPFSNSRLAAVGFTVAIVTFMQYALIVPVHAYNGTPRILVTLLPGIIIGTLFSLAYLLNHSAGSAQTTSRLES